MVGFVFGHTALGKGIVAPGRRPHCKGGMPDVLPAVVGTAATKNPARVYMEVAAVFVSIVAHIEVDRHVASRMSCLDGTEASLLIVLET